MDNKDTLQPSESYELPLLPLRDVVVYPHMVIPLFVGREKSIQALDIAMAADKRILLVAQKNAQTDEPEVEDLFSVGTVASILQLLKLPDGTVKVLVEGETRVSIHSVFEENGLVIAGVSGQTPEQIGEREAELLVRSVMSQFEQYVQLSKKVPNEVLSSLSGIKDPAKLVDTISAHMPMKIEDKQKMLEIVDLADRLEYLIGIMQGEMDFLQVEKKIRGRVKKQMERSQREYYLNEQMKAIQKEMNELDETPNEIDTIQARIDESGLSKEGKDKAESELQKLKMMSPMSAEATVVRAYLDWLLGCPWSKRSRVRHDLLKAKTILEADHYGLEEVKERILEYLAVQMRIKKSKSPVLCLVGPPGVGKTTLAKLIATRT
ncbi:MAG: LON peptidase substrate-binding domain-containing protein, partial [Endozoicomonas sp.]